MRYDSRELIIDSIYASLTVHGEGLIVFEI